MNDNTLTWETSLAEAQGRAERERKVILADFSKER